MRTGTAALVIVMVIAGSARAQPQPHAFVGARILTMAGPDIPSGVLVVHQGRIVAVGPDGTTAIPADARRIDTTGQLILPGLVDTHSHIGGGWGGDDSGPIQPDARILDSFNCRSPSIQRAQAGGITVVNVMPGSGHLLSGQTLYFKLRDADTIDGMLMYDGAGEILGGMKMANGTNSQRAEPFPGTRAKSAALVRAEFLKALDYQQKLTVTRDEPAKAPGRDLRMEGLLKVLNGEWIVHHHTHRHDDIMTVLRLAEEFDLRVVLHHVSEGWKVANEIAAAGVPCSIIIVDSPGGKIEAMNLIWETGMVLERAGVDVSIHTDDWINDSRLFLRCAALAVRAGMSRRKALEAVTIAGARMLGLAQRVGSLEVGKDADFIILDGDPLSVYTTVQQTYVDGLMVFDRADSADRLYATGGYGAGEDRSLHDHQLDY